MKYLKILFFLLLANYSKAQYGNYTNSNLSISFLEPALGAEYSVAPKSTLKLRMAITALSSVYKQKVMGMDDYFISYTVHPIASVSYRNYYNIIKRDNLGKRTDNNSANYISVSAFYLFKNLNEPSVEGVVPPKGGLMPAILWGLQRSFNNRMFVDFNIGPGYHIDESKIIPMSELSFGIHL